VGHVEAGLRSRDWRMPEEHNRVMIDHISDALFVSSEHARATAESESVQGHIFVTGSTIVESLEQALASTAGSSHRRAAKPFVLVTLHRKENVDDLEVLEGLVEALSRVAAKLDQPVVWPVHPRTHERLKRFRLLRRLGASTGVHLRDPAGHLEFVSLLATASLVLTDSGGVQQEACILRVPCVTARPTTEWIETEEVGANAVVGTRPDAIVEACVAMCERSRDWADPFSLPGASASRRIVESTLKLIYDLA
jgi:UDP-N-acetylglucosamine 2-epimerase (non-hydrolysing)